MAFPSFFISKKRLLPCFEYKKRRRRPRMVKYRFSIAFYKKGWLKTVLSRIPFRAGPLFYSEIAGRYTIGSMAFPSFFISKKRLLPSFT